MLCPRALPHARLFRRADFHDAHERSGAPGPQSTQPLRISLKSQISDLLSPIPSASPIHHSSFLLHPSPSSTPSTSSTPSASSHLSDPSDQSYPHEKELVDAAGVAAYKPRRGQGARPATGAQAAAANTITLRDHQRGNELGCPEVAVSKPGEGGPSGIVLAGSGM